MKEEPYVIDAKQYRIMRLAILILMFLAITGWMAAIFVGNVIELECKAKYGDNNTNNFEVLQYEGYIKQNQRVEINTTRTNSTTAGS